MSKKIAIRSGIIISTMFIAGLIFKYNIVPDRPILALTETCPDPLPERDYLDRITEAPISGSIDGKGFYPNEIWLRNTEFGGLHLRDNDTQLKINISQLGKALPKIYSESYKEYKINEIRTIRGIEKKYYVIAGFYPARNDRVTGRIYLCDEVNMTYIEGYFDAEIID